METEKLEKVKSENSNTDLQTVVKRAAFTLAEVMITMAVIGIVAALIIPKFVQGAYEHVWTNSLLTTYSKLNEGFSHIMTAEQVPEIGDTEVFSAIGGDGICSSEMDPNGEECKEFFTKLKKYFKFEVKEAPSEYAHIENLDGNEAVFMELEGWHEGLLSGLGQNTIQLSNGTLIYYYYFSKHSLQDDMSPYEKYSTLVVDINGADKPNILGRDIFKFHISDEGKVIPAGSLEDTKFIFKTVLISSNVPLSEVENEVNHNLDDFRREYLYFYPCYNLDDQSSSSIYQKIEGDTNFNGNGCAGRVIEEKKMNY